MQRERAEMCMQAGFIFTVFILILPYHWSPKENEWVASCYKVHAWFVITPDLSLVV